MTPTATKPSSPSWSSRVKTSAAELKQFLLARLPAWQVPREWRFVDSLAGNTRGKISRAEWRRKFQPRE